MFIKILIIATIGVYTLLNLVMCLMYSPKVLAKDLWSSQKWYGKIANNIFFAPMWFLTLAIIIFAFVLYWIIKIIAISTMWLTSKMFATYKKIIKFEV